MSSNSTQRSSRSDRSHRTVIARPRTLSEGFPPSRGLIRSISSESPVDLVRSQQTDAAVRHLSSVARKSDSKSRNELPLPVIAASRTNGSRENLFVGGEHTAFGQDLADVECDQHRSQVRNAVDGIRPMSGASSGGVWVLPTLERSIGPLRITDLRLLPNRFGRSLSDVATTCVPPPARGRLLVSSTAIVREKHSFETETYSISGRSCRRISRMTRAHVYRGRSFRVSLGSRRLISIVRTISGRDAVAFSRRQDSHRKNRLSDENPDKPHYKADNYNIYSDRGS